MQRLRQSDGDINWPAAAAAGDGCLTSWWVDTKELRVFAKV